MINKMYCPVISFTFLIYYYFSVYLVYMLPLIPHPLLYISSLLVSLSCPSSTLWFPVQHGHPKNAAVVHTCHMSILQYS
jgi:hypothetical protein